MERSELFRLIFNARDEALGWESVHTQAMNDAAKISAFVGDEIDFKDLLVYLNSIKHKGVIPVSLVDMRQVMMEVGAPPFSTDQLISHEASHVAVAERYGLVATTGVQLARKGGFSVFCRALTFVNFPDNLDENLARQIIRDIAQAPGDDMSWSDQKSLPQNN